MHRNRLLQLVEMPGKARFEVAGLVLVHKKPLGIFVDQADEAGQLFLGRFFVGQCPEIPNRIAHGLGKVTVIGFLFLGLPDSFQ